MYSEFHSTIQQSAHRERPQPRLTEQPHRDGAPKKRSSALTTANNQLACGGCVGRGRCGLCKHSSHPSHSSGPRRLCGSSARCLRQLPFWDDAGPLQLSKSLGTPPGPQDKRYPWRRRAAPFLRPLCRIGSWQIFCFVSHAEKHPRGRVTNPAARAGRGVEAHAKSPLPPRTRPSMGSAGRWRDSVPGDHVVVGTRRMDRAVESDKAASRRGSDCPDLAAQPGTGGRTNLVSNRATRSSI